MALFYLDITHIVTTFVILSLASYICFAILNLNHPFGTQPNFINQIIIYSLLTIAEAVILIIKELLIKRNYLNHLMFIVVFGLFILLYIILFAHKLYQLINSKQVAWYAFLPIKLFTSLISIFMFTFGYQDWILVIALLYYLVMASLFIYNTLHTHHRTSNFGTYYMLIGVIIILINHLLKAYFTIEFTIVVDLSASILLIIGFFIYYSDYYIFYLENQLKELKETNHQLSIAKEKIDFLSYYHPTTQLRNMYQLKKDIESSKLDKHYLLLINIKDFNEINNLIGFKYGNNILKRMAQLMEDVLQEANWLYHYYNDKFILVYKGNEQGVINLARQLFMSISTTEFSNLLLTPYIGITKVTALTTYDTIIKELEIASKKAKRTFSPFAFFQEEDSISFKKSIDLALALKKAVDQESWELYYQPQVNANTGKIIGFEALIRWSHQGTFISPDIFIPLAEKHGFINAIADFVIRKVFEQSNAFFSHNKALYLSINLSAYQLFDEQIIDYIQRMQESYHVPPEKIIFEITETALIHNVEKANETIQRLKSMGYQFSLDDFGTGYSSLYYFSQLDLDEIKFDKIFIDRALLCKKSNQVFHGMASLFESLGLRTVIEGVETEAQLHLIKKMGCSIYQGYYYSPPLPFDRALALLKES